MRTLINSAFSIGPALARAVRFDRVYAADRIEEAARADLDLVVATAVAPLAPAANQAASHDLCAVRRLQEVMATCRIARLTLISSCVVYPEPFEVDERDPIKTGSLGPYARHRYELERWCRDRFETTVVRLPHVFGAPLRSKVRHPAGDLARLAARNPASTEQHYDLGRLAEDLGVVARLGQPLVNLATPPLADGRVLAELGVEPLPGARAAGLARSDVRSAYAEAFGGADGYIETAAAELARIAAYVAADAPDPLIGSLD
ncbi:MAG: NAD-dependent epimerase/dehydratase family protein [Bifidobacteriaceae bacterium]|jgi:hypothetical protein|nr:NAD-dependent epimerase/dehydratase family protein [Bifidobacteriaceae bacterium]